MGPVDRYREWLRVDFRDLGCLDEDEIQSRPRGVLEWTIRHEPTPNWHPRDQAKWTVWSGLGLFVLGHHEHLDNALEWIIREPLVTTWLPCRGYEKAIGDLLPLPDGHSISDPGILVAWYRDNRDRLRWLEDEGRYVLISTKESC